MAAAPVFSDQPMSEINTTPLIDVLLVLLIVMVMTIPITTHSLDFNLPQPGPGRIDKVANSLTLTPAGRAEWNGVVVSDGRLAALLAGVRAMRPEPEVQFEPAADASYERSAQVLRIVEASRVTRFGFVGNEKYRAFGRGGQP